MAGDTRNDGKVKRPEDTPKRPVPTSGVITAAPNLAWIHALAAEWRLESPRPSRLDRSGSPLRS